MPLLNNVLSQVITRQPKDYYRSDPENRRKDMQIDLAVVHGAVAEVVELRLEVFRKNGGVTIKEGRATASLVVVAPDPLQLNPGEKTLTIVCQVPNPLSGKKPFFMRITPEYATTSSTPIAARMLAVDSAEFHVKSKDPTNAPPDSLADDTPSRAPSAASSDLAATVIDLSRKVISMRTEMGELKLELRAMRAALRASSSSRAAPRSAAAAAESDESDPSAAAAAPDRIATQLSYGGPSFAFALGAPAMAANKGSSSSQSAPRTGSKRSGAAASQRATATESRRRRRTHGGYGGGSEGGGDDENVVPVDPRSHAAAAAAAAGRSGAAAFAIGVMTGAVQPAAAAVVEEEEEEEGEEDGGEDPGPAVVDPAAVPASAGLLALLPALQHATHSGSVSSFDALQNSSIFALQGSSLPAPLQPLTVIEQWFAHG